MILASYIRRLVGFYAFFVFFGVGLLLLAIEWLLQFSSLHADYGSLQALAYAALLLPRNLYAAAPMLLLCTIHVLYVREQGRGSWLGCLVTGQSLRTLHLWVMSILASWILLFTMFGEGLGPIMTMQAKQLRMFWQHHQSFMVASNGLWLAGDDGIVYLEGIDGQRIVHSVWYQPKEEVMHIHVAEEVRYVNSHWTADSSQHLTLGHKQAVHAWDHGQIWPIRLSPMDLRFSMRAPEERPLMALIKFAKDQESVYLCWKRILYPVWLVILSFLILMKLPRNAELLSASHWVRGLCWILSMLVFEQTHGLFLTYGPAWLIASAPIILYSLFMTSAMIEEWSFE